MPKKRATGKSTGGGRGGGARSGGGGRGWRRVKFVFWFNVALVAGIAGWFAVQPEVRRTEVLRLVDNSLERGKKVGPLDVIRDIWTLYYSQDYVSAPELPGGRETHFYAGQPRTTSAAAGVVRVLNNRGYAVGYSEQLGNPVWATYRIADIKDMKEPPPRPEVFEADSRTVARVAPSDYSHSGYDRGHLAPNYAIATRYGPEAQRETFLMSNITPQKHALNAGPWKQLELKIATAYAARFNEVWVVAGPVFGPKPARLRGGVSVPEAFYMIVVDENEGRVNAQAFLFPQEAGAGGGGGAIGDYLTSIDEIERRVGLDFFSELPDASEAALESRRPSRAW